MYVHCTYFKKFYGISFIVLEEMDIRGFKNLNIKIVYLIRDFKMQRVFAKFSRLKNPRFSEYFSCYRFFRI